MMAIGSSSVAALSVAGAVATGAAPWSAAGPRGAATSNSRRWVANTRGVG